jgi:hypothetical protein
VAETGGGARRRTHIMETNSSRYATPDLAEVDCNLYCDYRPISRITLSKAPEAESSQWTNL